VKEAKNVTRSVAFRRVTVEGREKLFSSRPVVSYAGSNIMMKWNYDIRIHYEVTQRTDCTLYLSDLNYDTSVWLQPAAAAMEGFGIRVKKKIFSAVSLEFPYFHFSIPLVNRVE
jgi:hypothetical protein